MVFVKICGVRSARAAGAAAEAGADAIGFVFADSPRRVSLEQARRIARSLPPGVVRVAVMRHPTQAEWDEVIDGFRPDWLQTDAADFLRLGACPDVMPLPVFRDEPALDVRAVASTSQALFEARTSGAGQLANWSRAAELARTTRLILAGGLVPGNVTDAIRQVSPWGVDVSSGVESRRGRKDTARIAAFIEAARNTER